jgi:LmbE family N-acetylglucosaminyl deacetylase
LKTLFLAPHNDDEGLFGAYIIQIYEPRVVILTDSYIQYERGEMTSLWTARRLETLAAMDVLNPEVEVDFAGIPDKEFNAERCEASLLWYTPARSGVVYDRVFSPAPNEGGNWMHDVTGQVADKLFPEASRHYSTYTKDREYPAGVSPIEASEEMKAKKLKAIACYKSQMRNCCRMYLTTPHKDEYLV